MEANEVIGGKYELKKFLGEGGLGRVYLATQQPMGREVAVKLLHPELSSDAGLSARFAREATAASRVSHPNTVTIYDFGRDVTGPKPVLYLVMEYLRGETLHERIQGHPKRRLPSWEAVQVLSQVLRPLSSLHKAGVVHRDLKPDNIMLCQGEVGEQVKLLDFGIAKMSGMTLTATGQMVGTPHYMSPEQILAHKELGPEVDIYAMGVLLYEALTGDPPYLAAHHIDLFRMHLQERPKALHELYPREPHLWHFDAVIARAMAKAPADRYRSADEMRQAMESALVASVAEEDEAQEKTRARRRLTPSWWLEEKTTTEALQEEPTATFPVGEANTLTLPRLEEPGEATVQMEALPPWTELKTVLTPLPGHLLPQPTWIGRVGHFWKKVSQVWQLLRLSRETRP